MTSQRDVPWAFRVIALSLVLLTMSVPVAAQVPVVSGSTASHYELAVDFDPVARSLDGGMRVSWRNGSGQAVDVLHFRLYPNASYYEEGETVVSAVTVDGEAAAPELLADPTVLAVPLGRAVPPGDGVMVELAFRTIVPAMSEASFGILGGNAESGWWLADWYPILAGREGDDGPFLDPPTPFGDPTFAESATYRLAFTAPDDYRVVGSGSEEDRVVNGATGQAITTIESGLGRDLALSLLPDEPGDRPVTVTADVAGIAVRASLPPRLAISGLGEEILDIARDALPVYGRWLGPYHEPELDIVPVPLAGAGGVTWHGLVWLDLNAIAADGVVSAGEREELRFVLTHELGHQWIGGIVGSNNNDYGFMSEGLTNILTVLVIREVDGPAVAEAYLREWVASGYRVMVETSGDGIVDAPIRASTDIVMRARLVYGKAALGFEAIRQEIGDAAFFAALDAYAREYRFAISTPGDLRDAFETAGGTDLTAVWSLWFEERATTVADIDALLDGFAST